MPAPVDMDSVVARMLSDRAVFSALFSEFLADMDQKYPRLVSAYQQQDYPTLLHLAHYIKGAALNLGANPLGGYAKELEFKTRAEEMEDADELVTRIGAEIPRIREFLAAKIS